MPFAPVKSKGQEAFGFNLNPLNEFYTIARKVVKH